MAYTKKDTCNRGHQLIEGNLYTYTDRKTGKLKRKCAACVKINNDIRKPEQKSSWAKRHPERVAEIARNWRKRNPEKSRNASRESERKRRTEKREEWLAAKRSWNERNKERCAEYARKSLCKKHGIEYGTYKIVFDAQGGKCKLCRQPETERNGFLCIDHDHFHCNGRHGCQWCFRGLLCNKCNQGLGCFKDSPELLEKAAQYIRAFAGEHTRKFV